MTKLIIYLKEHEFGALKTLAELEYRVPKAQASLIIREELERRGMVAVDQKKHSLLTQPLPATVERSVKGD